MTRDSRPLSFAAIKQHVTPEQVLRRLGWRPVGRGGRQLRGPCILHGSTDPQSRSLSVGLRITYCHKCKRFADVIGLWAAAKSLSLLEAAYDLCAEFSIPPPYLR